MRLCNETITVFNARFDPATDRDVYHGTVIKGVSWFGRNEASTDKTGLNASDSVTVRVPVGAEVEGGKSYIDYRQYPYADPSKTFTFNTGDIVVHAAVSDVDPRPATLLKQYEAFTVLSATDNRRTVNAPHWKVVGG